MKLIGTVVAAALLTLSAAASATHMAPVPDVRLGTLGTDLSGTSVDFFSQGSAVEFFDSSHAGTSLVDFWFRMAADFSPAGGGFIVSDEMGDLDTFVLTGSGLSGNITSIGSMPAGPAANGDNYEFLGAVVASSGIFAPEFAVNANFLLNIDIGNANSTDGSIPGFSGGTGDITLAAAVPAPGALLLILAGLGLMGGARRIRRTS